MRNSHGSAADAAFSPQVFHILLALASGPLHGYAIMQSVEQDTDGAIRLGPGTLYGAVKRLSDDGMIEETRAAQGAEEGRRYYRLTPAGRAAVRREAARLARTVDTARARRVLPAEGT